MVRATNPDSRRRAGDDRHHGTADRNGSDKGSPDRSGSGRLSGARAAALAQEQLEQLIQRPCEFVSGLSRQDDGGVVSLEVVELERVPPTTDILATYRVDLDRRGELMGYERVQRYYRNQAGGDS